MMYLGKDAIGLNHMISNLGHDAILESGSYTPTQDIITNDLFIPHSLGVTPDFLICTSNFETSKNQSANYLLASYIIKYPIVSVLTSTADTIAWSMFTQINSSNGAMGTNAAVSRLETIFSDENHSSTEFFRFPMKNEEFKLKANITYKYVIGKFNNQEVTSNA